jgi:hypothetical protein
LSHSAFTITHKALQKRALKEIVLFENSAKNNSEIEVFQILNLISQRWLIVLKYPDDYNTGLDFVKFSVMCRANLTIL